LATGQSFDVMVVGAGAAGSVVAGRLSENRSRSVLLLEAGPDIRAEPPPELLDGWGLPQIPDWGYVSEPKASGDVQKLRRGKLLGGTSWLTRFAVRGSPADFDAWAAAGNPGWSFAEVLPWFKRLENDADFGDEPWHGSSGAIPINRYLDIEPTAVGTAVQSALEASGFPSVKDHNDPEAIGAGRMPMSSAAGLRVTSAQAYLDARTPRPGLTVRPNAQVAEIVLDGNKARGVRFLDGTIVNADRVVLCAGTYGSPPILLRSGIGPVEHLRALRIAVRADLSGVGRNLADHPEVDIDCGYRGEVRTSPLLHTIATFRSAPGGEIGPPDLMLWIPEPSQSPGETPLLEIDAVLLKPLGRGSVRLRSTDPVDPPLIELPRLEEPSDLDRLAEAYERALEVANRPELRRLCKDKPSPALRGTEMLDWIRRTVYSIPHVVGTCAMGPSPDAGAVVDALGRVHGIEDLFVVDASIVPDAPSGFPHLVTIMLAERLSDEIALGI
jgi:choline dehydrogenase